jgi:hypothetical protein
MCERMCRYEKNTMGNAYVLFSDSKDRMLSTAYGSVLGGPCRPIPRALWDGDLRIPHVRCNVGGVRVPTVRWGRQQPGGGSVSAADPRERGKR